MEAFLSNPLAVMGATFFGLTLFSVLCVWGHYMYQKATALPSDPECVGGKTPCNCTCSYDCLLA